MQGAGTNALVDRMIGAARLDVNTYESVERDESATTSALIVVVLAAIASGIGGLGDGNNAVAALIGGAINSVLSWIVFSAAAYFVGTRLLASATTHATVGQLLRTLGFAQAPLLLGVVGFIPLLGPLVAGIAGIWYLVCSVIALRQALEVSTLRAVAIGLVTAVVIALVSLVLALIFGGAAYGLSQVV